MGLLYGGLLGIALPLLEKAFPKAEKYIPSAMGIGLAMVIPWFNSLSMCLGSGIAMLLEKKRPKLAERYVIPVASGLIAGESIMGIAVALLGAAGVI
jgi:uncharacterized oligopeptide transporter (OPT) family protein